MLCVFFFKQKTAYEMRISDWSSDVCSSDLWPTAMPRNRSASAWPPPMRRPASWRGRCRGFDALRELRDGHRVVDPWVVRHHRIKIRKRQPVLVTAIVEREINDAECGVVR